MDVGTELNTASTDAGPEHADPLADFPRDAKPWNDLINDGEAAFRTYNEKCDNVDKLFASLSKLSDVRADREFQMFWANMEVVKPSMYSRPPLPVVVPRFKDMRELPRVASELLERVLQTTFDKDDIHDALMMVRDDVGLNGRGATWLRYDAGDDGQGGLAYECVRFDHVDRKDFLHEPARKWKECSWVARRSYLNRADGIKRFGDEFGHCQFKSYKPEDGGDYEGEKKAQVWELWHKGKNVVVWISPGLPEVLDVQEPFLSLDGFFPCPKPAYATVQRGTMIPVPDMLFYKDQLEEINELTARISGLSDMLRMRGFYASGEESLGGAVERAIKTNDNNAILHPVPVHLLQGGGLKDAVMWLPVVDVATTIKELVALRKQIIDDVYQISGISDIMRGDTNANETLGAQKLKSQYASSRIKDRQQEMIRVARDMTRIAAEIIAENFSPQTLISMSQMQLPQRAQLQMQLQQMQQQAAMHGQPFQPPKMPVAVEDVIELLHQERIRPFTLDIETDSTIQPDEDAEKQRANEYLAAMGGFLQQAVPMVMQVPQSAPLLTETLKFVAQKYRAGRALEGAIEEFAEQTKKLASEPRPNPEAEKMKHDMAMADRKQAGEDAKAQAEVQAKQFDGALKQKDLEIKALDLQTKQIELQIKGYDAQGKVMELEKAANEPAEQPPQEDPLDRDAKILANEHSRVDLDVKHKENEHMEKTRKNESRMIEAATMQGESITRAVEAMGELLAKVSESQQQLVKAITAPKRGKRMPDGTMQIETVVN